MKYYTNRTQEFQSLLKDYLIHGKKNKFKNDHGTCTLKSTVALRYEYIETN